MDIGPACSLGGNELVSAAVSHDVGDVPNLSGNGVHSFHNNRSTYTLHHCIITQASSPFIQCYGPQTSLMIVELMLTRSHSTIILRYSMLALDYQASKALRKGKQR